MSKENEVVGKCLYCDEEIFENDECYLVINQLICCDCMNDFHVQRAYKGLKKLIRKECKVNG